MQPDALITWTDERVETLKTLWKEGLSASQIAGRLGGVSRNAVVGKVHRIGLPGRKARHHMTFDQHRMIGFKAKARHMKSAGKAIPKKISASPVFHAPPPRVNDVARFTLKGLESHHCRYPVGNPGQSGFGFCGLDKHAGTSYCISHAALCFVPINTRAVIRKAFRTSQLTGLPTFETA